MPLRFEPPADPLTTTASAVSHVIESDALQRLTKEIERYGRRELAGRSILIAGHRGVGKTTLVRKAIENVRGARSAYQGRPLFVDLHGPDLLAPPDKKEAGRKNGQPAEAAKTADEKSPNPSAKGEKKPAAEAAGPSQQPSGADLQSFVERLTFSLYRAAAKEFVDSFRALRNPVGPAGESRYREYSELAEQFALELDGSTDLGRIRLLYERVDAFKEGVLNTSTSSTGSQELALLAASSQAYRIISGKLAEDQQRETTGKNTANWSIAADNLLSPVTGLLTGGLAWAALPAELGPLAKLFTSFTAGLASAIAVKFTRTVQRESTQSSKVSFVPRRNRRALRRLLPVLVDRFCDVGLPPIFVVDELDKVQDISERMEGLMGFLKQFVTERAFFCFLVDRDYYERLEATVSTCAFPKEATLFGDRLFVQYAPESAHNYLKNVIKVGTLATGESQDDAARDLEVLRYVLLRRSYMHPFDLRREISRSTNAKNEFRFPPRALFNVQQYRNEVYYQVAVECVLAYEKMLDFAEDPNRAQLLYDALYFPIRTKKLPDEFDASRDSLKRHLAGRMGKENGNLLSKEDLDILHHALLALVRFLCEPRALLDTMQSLAVAKYLPEPKVFPQAAVGVIEAAAGPKPAAAPAPIPAETQQGSPAPAPIITAKAAPLLIVGTEAGRYCWQFDKYGYPLPEAIPVEAKAAVPTKALESPAGIEGSGEIVISTEVISLLGDFENAAKWLATKRGTAIDIELWEQMRLIPTPPTWSYLRDAADSLRNPASLPPTKVEEYNKALMEYRSNLKSALSGIWYALAVAAKMAAHARKSSPAAAERRSLEILAEVLAGTSARDQMLKQLEEIAKEAVKGIFYVSGSYRTMLEALEIDVNTVRQQPAIAATHVTSQSGTFYEQWLVQFYEGRQPLIDALWPFLSWAMGSLPLGLQTIDPLRMTIHDWTKANSQEQSLRQRAVGLERLGFRRDAEKLALEPGPEDPLLGAMLQSIRKRGYEKASVILQPVPALRETLTQPWLPSENIACRVRMPGTDLPSIDAAYVLVEVYERISLDQIRLDVTNLRTATRVALFGPDISFATIFRGYPFISSPQGLDDLVERLDSRPPSDWADPKSALR